MIIVFTMLVIGAVIGHYYRGNKYVIRYIHIVSFWSVLILLFLLGFAVGQNELITSNLHKIGLKSLVLSIGTVVGSSLMSMLVYRKYFMTEKDK
jgi:Kef-type K+ transport system membrane component KefB